MYELPEEAKAEVRKQAEAYAQEMIEQIEEKGEAVADSIVPEEVKGDEEEGMEAVFAVADMFTDIVWDKINEYTG